MSVYKKICEVMKKVEYLQKDGALKVGDEVKYKFLSEEKITSEIHKAIQDIGLVMYPAKMEILQERVLEGKVNKYGQKAADSNIVTIKAIYRIVDAEDDSFIDIEVFGEGADTMDKRLTKAMSCAYKYMQRQTFALSSGDDPDRIASPETEEDLAPATQDKQQTLVDKAKEHNDKPQTTKKDPVKHYCANCASRGVTREISLDVAQDSMKKYKMKLCRNCQQILEKNKAQQQQEQQQ